MSNPQGWQHNHIMHRPFLCLQRQLLAGPDSTGRAKQRWLSERQAVLLYLWSKQVQQPLKAPETLQHSPSHPQEQLPTPCPFGSAGTDLLEQHESAKSGEHPSHNQLCTTHYKEKTNKKNTTGMERGGKLVLFILIWVVFWQFMPTSVLAEIVLNGSTKLKGKCGVWTHWGISFVRTKPPVADLMTWQKHCK